MNPDIIEDYESDEDHPQSNPFPGADKVTWTRTFSVALHETTGLPWKSPTVSPPTSSTPRTTSSGSAAKTVPSTGSSPE